MAAAGIGRGDRVGLRDERRGRGGGGRRRRRRDVGSRVLTARKRRAAPARCAVVAAPGGCGHGHGWSTARGLFSRLWFQALGLDVSVLGLCFTHSDDVSVLVSGRVAPHQYRSFTGIAGPWGAPLLSVAEGPPAKEKATAVFQSVIKDPPSIGACRRPWLVLRGPMGGTCRLCPQKAQWGIFKKHCASCALSLGLVIHVPPPGGRE